jgi:hypothetical protein
MAFLSVELTSPPVRPLHHGHYCPFLFQGPLELRDLVSIISVAQSLAEPGTE